MSADHDTLQELSGLYALGALTAGERSAFEAHLAGCDMCRAEVAALRSTAMALPHTVRQIEPPLALRERVMRAATGGDARAIELRAVPATGHKRPGGDWLLVAASLVAAASLGAYSLQLRGRIADLDAQLQQAVTQATLARQQIADARRTSLELQSQLGVLAAPDLVRVDLRGQPNAPAASARAFWSRARGMVFTASNLPALPAGRVYQVWVLPASGPPVSVGLLQPDQAADRAVVFETSPDIPAPAQVAVSDEPAGGVAAPTGMIWLAGTPVA
jgi:anti-sigma-K factor RskA